MTDSIIDWLRAQLDDDERTVRRAADYDDGAAHDVHGPPGTWACLDESEWFGPSYRGGVIAPRIGNVNAPELGAHIVAWHPARVLREIDAKRQLIADFLSEKHEVVEDCWYTCSAATEERDGGETCDDNRRGGPCDCGRDARVARRLRLLALPYADRPGYAEAIASAE